jgi:AraC-like DNA-binding protein
MIFLPEFVIIREKVLILREELISMNKAVCKNLLKKNSLLQKMLISIVCMLCIPLLGVQVFSFLRASRELEKNNTAQYVAMLQALSDSFENEIDALTRMASHISANKEVAAPLKGNVNEHTIDAASSALNNYNLAHPLIDGTGIYYKTIDTVLYHTSQMNMSSFCDLFYAGDSAGRAKLEHLFKQAEAAERFVTGSVEGCLKETLVLAVPVSLSTDRDAVIFFTIDISALENWCSVFIPTGSGFGIMADDNKYLLLGEKDTAQAANDLDFQNFLTDPEKTSYVHTTDADTYIFYKYHHHTRNSIFLVSIPENAAEKYLLHYAGEMKLILAITVILTCILVIVTLYINYMPIFRLVKRYIKTDPGNQQMSELELLDSHFLAQNDRISVQERMLGTFVVGDILCGASIPQEDLQRYFPKTIYKSFVAVAAELSLTAEQSMRIINGVEGTLGGKLIITTVPNRPETVFVRAADTVIDMQELRNSLQQYVEALVTETCSFHMGLVVSELNQIPLSYYEALFADKLTDFLGDDEEREKVSDLIRSFEDLLLTGRHVKALQLIDRLETAEQELRASIKQLYYYKIIHTYLSALQRSGVNLNNKEIDQLLFYKNSEQLFTNLRRSIMGLPAAAEVLSISPQERQERLLAYVDKNYLDNTICLTSVADYMQTSIYTVSRLFKEITGQGFKEYIMNKRLQKACSLLEASHLPVSEIALVCGFDDANYFTIVFKRKYGMPPSKYRDDITTKDKQNEVLSK